MQRPLPRWVTEITRGIEPLWVGAAAGLWIIWGYAVLPHAIRMLGRSGRAETVEWAVYMSLLAGFPVLCILIGLAMPRLLEGRAATVVKAFVIVVAFALGAAFLAEGRLVMGGAAMVAALITTVTSFGAYRIMGERDLAGLIWLAVIWLVALVAWMTGGGLVYWTNASDWFTGSAWRLAAFAVAVAVAIAGLPKLGETADIKAPPGVAFRIVSVLVLLVLIVFSFRTNPVVEFYHWGFWVGPIEQLRQGGWLLFDTPSQYGLVSVLIPTLFPGSAWISFWYYQAAIYAVVGAMMYVIFRRLRGGVGNLALAFLAVFTTLFFRPRTASLILPAQMTPSGGPVRFLWCFVLLGWLLLVFRDAVGHKEKAEPGTGFPLVGHVIWICAVAWSFEAAIYCSAIWFSAFSVYLVQKRKHIIRQMAVPVAMLLGLYAIVWLVYRIGAGVSPDLTGYTEFGFLYSRGFGSLPIDTDGAIWYLILVFMIVSTVVVHFLVEDWKDFRLVVAAGVWGGVWSLASYFVSRSHPVNLLSITPVLLFGMAVLLIVIRHTPRRPWHAYARAASVPVFAIPIAMTLGHPGLWQNVKTPQLSPARFNEQIPRMDRELHGLLQSAGVKASDPIVRIVDGRLMLPAWPGALMSDKSWLPKPYEIIGSLPPDRRAVYLERNARSAHGGWLLHHQRDTLAHFERVMDELHRYYDLTPEQSGGPWRLWRVTPLR